MYSRHVGKSLAKLIDSLSSPSSLELLIGYDEYYLEDVLNELLKHSDLVHLYRHIPYLAVRCESGYARSLGEMCTHACSIVRTIDLSHEVSTFQYEDNSPGSAALWNLAHVGAPDAWQFATGSGIGVAVIDTGIDYDHPALKDRFTDLLGYNVTDPDSSPWDDNGHGTHCAGIVAGKDTGVAPGCTLYAVKVLDDYGRGSEADVIAGLEWVIEQGIDIASLSLGSAGASRAFGEVCERAYSEGMFIVAAAGNESRGPSYPASFGESVIAVAATNSDKEHPRFSNIYPTNDISAPGVNIYSTYPDKRYLELTGTSMATPHVAGALALARELSRDANLEALMKESAEKLEWRGRDPYGDVFGAGLLRADKLVKKLAGSGKLKKILARR